jgi:hypothetical protein
MTGFTDASLARVEQRLTKVAEDSERRDGVLSAATAEFVAVEFAPRDAEIVDLKNETVSLKKRVSDLESRLEQKRAVDQQVAEIATRLEERQERRDRAKDGITVGDFIQTMSMMIAQERQSAREEFKAAVEEAQCAFEAKLTTKLEAFEQRIVQLTDQRIKERDGKDADPEAVARFVGERIEEPLHEFIRAQIDTKLTALEERLKAVPGKLPVAKPWRSESVTYQAEFVSHEGSLYQAKTDTARPPGSSDWVCVARAGRDALMPVVRGTYDVHEDYKMLNIVALDGGSFIAKYDNPGICPGDGWQLLCKQGKPGRKGETGPKGPRGEKGERGEAGPTTVSWQLDRVNYRVSALMSNGTVGPILELRGLFEQFLIDRGE